MTYDEAIAQINQKLKNAYLPFIYVPGAGMTLTQGFGSFFHPEIYKQFSMAGHNGLDWAMPIGSRLIAVEDGVVYQAQGDDTGYGKFVKIRNSHGDIWVYGHMSRVDVAVGQRVVRGQVIGLSGNTGFVIPKPTPQDPSAGAHQHFGLRPSKYDYNNGFLGYIDPTPRLQSLINPPMIDPAPYNEKIIRNQGTGGYALVIRGKKYKFGGAQDTAAFLTFLQRNNGNIVDHIRNVPPEVYNGIPDSNGLSF